MEGVSMAYFGITSESQLIDYQRIRLGCESYIQALDDFVSCGNAVIQAGESCSKQALSVDGESMQSVIYEVGEQIGDLRDALASNAEAVYAQAVQIYNAQVAELNEYIRQQEELRRQQAQNNY